MKPKVYYAILGATVTGFFLGWLLFGIILDPFYKSQMVYYQGLVKTPPTMWAILIMNICFAVLLVYIFHVWAGVTTFMKGFTAGLLIFFLMMAGFDILMFGLMNLFPFGLCVVDIIANTLLGGIVGGVAGMILGMGKKETT